MNIYPKYNVGYQHIFKTAGSSVSEFLMDTLGPAVIHPYADSGGSEAANTNLSAVHGPLSFKKNIIRELIDRDNQYPGYDVAFEDLTILATIRNPFVRNVSAYEFIKDRQMELVGILPEKRILEVNECDFKTWLLNNLKNENQSEKLLINGELPDNVILIKVENLDLELRAFMSILGIYTNKKILVENSTKIPKPPLEYYDQELIDIILEAEQWLISNHYPDLADLSV